MVGTHCTDCDERSDERNKQIVPAQKQCMASEPEGNGHTMSWTSLQSLEVGAGSGSVSWSGVGKDGAKQYSMALQVGRNDQLEEAKKWSIARVFKKGDIVMISLHMVCETGGSHDIFSMSRCLWEV